MISDQLLTKATTAQKRVSFATAEPILSSMGKYGNLATSDSSVFNTSWNFAGVKGILVSEFGESFSSQVPTSLPPQEQSVQSLPDRRESCSP